MRKKKGELTTLLGGRRVPKYDLRPETYGTLDELNSFLGMARAISANGIVKNILFTIQNHVFSICSELALSGKNRSLLKGEITQEEIDWLTRLCRDFKALLKPDPQFVIYGETEISSALDVARAVSRRAERLVVRMKSRRMITNLNILDYLNRVSDVLYLVARYEERRANVRSKHPMYGSKLSKRTISKV